MLRKTLAALVGSAVLGTMVAVPAHAVGVVEERQQSDNQQCVVQFSTADINQYGAWYRDAAEQYLGGPYEGFESGSDFSVAYLDAEKKYLEAKAAVDEGKATAEDLELDRVRGEFQRLSDALSRAQEWRSSFNRGRAEKLVRLLSLDDYALGLVASGLPSSREVVVDVSPRNDKFTFEQIVAMHNEVYEEGIPYRQDEVWEHLQGEVLLLKAVEEHSTLAAKVACAEHSSGSSSYYHPLDELIDYYEAKDRLENSWRYPNQLEKDWDDPSEDMAEGAPVTQNPDSRELFQKGKEVRKRGTVDSNYTMKALFPESTTTDVVIQPGLHPEGFPSVSDTAVEPDKGSSDQSMVGWAWAGAVIGILALLGAVAVSVSDGVRNLLRF